MYLCIIDGNSEIVLHKNILTRRADFMRAVAPFQEDLAVVLGTTISVWPRNRFISKASRLQAADRRRFGPSVPESLLCLDWTLGRARTFAAERPEGRLQ